jgi:hypothetical protein
MKPRSECNPETVRVLRMQFFRICWESLAKVGVCDELDSAEFRRVAAAWVAMGYPPDIGRFVRKHSNQGSEGDE